MTTDPFTAFLGFVISKFSKTVTRCQEEVMECNGCSLGRDVLDNLLEGCLGSLDVPQDLLAFPCTRRDEHWPIRV